MKAVQATWTTIQTWLAWLQKPQSGPPFALCLWLLDALIISLTVKFVPYTEIDWSTYMEQVALVLGGERNYSHITGATGPCVYPAGYVWLYAALAQLPSRLHAQLLFALLYLVALALALLLALRARVPTPLLPLLVLSRRVHSLFALRLFNDAWVGTLLLAALALLSTRATPRTPRLLLDALAALLYSAAVSVKMGALLAAPALLVIWLKRHPLRHVALLLTICAVLQLLLAWPFLVADPVWYLKRSFDLGRVFEQRWSVNWQFLPEELFVSARWAALLLLCTVLLWAVLCVRVWARSHIDAVQTSIASSVLAGVLCARSVHYQFYAWYFFLLPLLLARTRLPLALRYALFVALEVAYTRYPPTPTTSALLVTAHALLLAAVLWNGPVTQPEDTPLASLSTAATQKKTGEPAQERRIPTRASARPASAASTSTRARATAALTSQ